MTDSTPDIELVSAYLDGETTADETARVESDPALLARVDEFRAVRSRLSTEAPAGLVDDHVSAALASFDESPARHVTPLAARRRRPLHQRIPLGAVAAAVVVLALFGALTQIDTGGSDETATAGDVSSDDAGEDEAAAEADSGDGTDDAAATSTGPSDTTSQTLDGEGDAGHSAPGAGASSSPYFYAFSDVDDLADHIVQNHDDAALSESARTDQDRYTSVPDDREIDPCDAAATAGVDPDAVTLVLPAVVAGEPVTAVVVDSDIRRLVVVDDTTCSVMDDRAL